MAGSLSDGTTGLTKLAIGGINSAGTSFGGLDLRTYAAVLSMTTGASASGMTLGELRIVMQASGLSLVYSSGKTTYTLGASATSAAQG